MKLYKIVYGKHVKQEAYIVASNCGDAENTFLQWVGVGQQINSIAFVSENVYIHNQEVRE